MKGTLNCKLHWYPQFYNHVISNAQPIIYKLKVICLCLLVMIILSFYFKQLSCRSVLNQINMTIQDKIILVKTSNPSSKVQEKKLHSSDEKNVQNYRFVIYLNRLKVHTNIASKKSLKIYLNLMVISIIRRFYSITKLKLNYLFLNSTNFKLTWIKLSDNKNWES